MRIPSTSRNVFRGILLAFVAFQPLACSDGQKDAALPPLAGLTLTASPSSAHPDRTVVFSLVGTSPTVITMSRIDFDGDGTWDETQAHSSLSISTTYDHAYGSLGTYAAVAQVLTTTDLLAEARSTITVVQNLPPSLEGTIACHVGYPGQGQSITWTDRCGYWDRPRTFFDPDGTVVAFRLVQTPPPVTPTFFWSFDTATGSLQMSASAHPGWFNVSRVAVDDDGAESAPWTNYLQFGFCDYISGGSCGCQYPGQC